MARREECVTTLLEPTPDKRKVALFFFCRRTLAGGLIVFQTKRTASFLDPGGVVAKLPWSLAPWTAAAAVVGSPTLDTPPRAPRLKTASFVVVLCWCCCCCCCRYSGFLPSVVKTCCCWLVVIYIFLDECVPLSFFFSVRSCASLSLLLLLYFCTV